MFRRSVPHNHPMLQLGFLPRAGEDVRALLFPKVALELLRKLLHNCPGIACNGSPIAGCFTPSDIDKSERWRWPGSKLLSQRHQIALSQKSPAEIEKQYFEIEMLAKQANISPLLSSILSARGLSNPNIISEYLKPSVVAELEKLPDYCRFNSKDPSNIAPMGRAVFKILEMIRCQKEIVIVADYDADGNCAAAIMTRAIWLIGGRCTVIQPDRQKDGYGLSDSILTKIKLLKPDLVITLDLGTTNKLQIDSLRQSGCATIVVDHHEFLAGKTAIPDVMLNPKSSQEWKGYQGLCASGLTWLLARALILRHGWVSNADHAITELLGIAAIGTVGDVVPLSNLNRAIVREGISGFKDSRIPAVKAICQYRGANEIGGEYLGFQVVPILNAPGRIKPGSEMESGSAITLEFLLSNSNERAQELLGEMAAWNTKRKALEDQGLIQAREQITQSVNKGEIVHSGKVVLLPNVHEGVVGLVAARMSESMQCPIVVLAKDQSGNWKGSGRSIPGVSLMQLLSCDDLKSSIEQYGGHEAAAGVRISSEKVGAFSLLFSRLCQETYGIISTKENPFSDSPNRLISPPSVERWVKTYNPDLIMTIEQLATRSNEVADCCMSLEPCGKDNPPLRIMLPRVEVVSCLETSGEHLRIVLRDGANPKGDWRSEERLEAIVFKRGLAKPVIAALKAGELLDLIVQPSFDCAKAMQGGRVNITANVVIAEPSVFTYAGEVAKKKQNVKNNNSGKISSQLVPASNDIFERFTVPKFTTIEQFSDFFGISILSDKVQFRERQLNFVARELLKDRAYEATRNDIPLHQNVLIKVNTGGGKTVIAFMKAAQVLSQDPSSKVLYLAPQHDLCEQTMLSAKEMLKLQADQIVEVTGELSPAKRKACYAGPGRLFIGTPQTLENDGDLSMFNFVILDEIHLMRGDESGKSTTKYAYRWVVNQVIELQEQGRDIRLWAQSGSPATTREELTALIKTLHARWAKAWLPTGRNDWNALKVSLPKDYQENLLHLARCYQDCFRELKKSMPTWLKDSFQEREISSAHGNFGDAVRSFYNVHESKDNRVFPSRIQLLEKRASLLKAIDLLEKEFKSLGTNTIDKAFIWKLRSGLHELQMLSSLYEELRSKGRSAFQRAVSHLMLQTIYPVKKNEPERYGHYRVRAFRNEHFKKIMRWALVEPTAKIILKEFERIYPGISGFGSFRNSNGKSNTIRIALEKLLSSKSETIENGAKIDSTAKQTKIADLLDSRLRHEMLESTYSDPKEIEIINWLHNIPTKSKVMIMCEEKFEAELLAARLSRSGIAAQWYAGKSVKKSVGLKNNLEQFRRGEVQVLCATSAADTGHDIEQVSYIVRLAPLTSPKKNAQTRGRVGRQEGLKGDYLFVVAEDSNPDIDEMQKFMRAKSRLSAMEKIG